MKFRICFAFSRRETEENLRLPDLYFGVGAETCYANPFLKRRRRRRRRRRGGPGGRTNYRKIFLPRVVVVMMVVVTVAVTVVVMVLVMVVGMVVRMVVVMVVVMVVAYP